MTYCSSEECAGGQLSPSGPVEGRALTVSSDGSEEELVDHILATEVQIQSARLGVAVRPAKRGSKRARVSIRLASLTKALEKTTHPFLSNSPLASPLVETLFSFPVVEAPVVAVAFEANLSFLSSSSCCAEGSSSSRNNGLSLSPSSPADPTGASCTIDSPRPNDPPLDPRVLVGDSAPPARAEEEEAPW